MTALSPEVKAGIFRLRATIDPITGRPLSKRKISIIVGCSESGVFFTLHPKVKKPKPAPPPQTKKPLEPTRASDIFGTPRRLPSSAPIPRMISGYERSLQQMTREQMYVDLQKAVLNTSRRE